MRRHWHLFKRGTWYTLVLLLVLVAGLSIAARQLLPEIDRHPQQIQQWLSARAQRPVRFDAVHTRWTRLGPLLELKNLRVGEPADPLRIGDAELVVSPFIGLLPSRSMTELRLRGLDLTLQRQANGQWRVRGLPGQQDEGDPLQALEHLGELQIVQAKLRVFAPELGLDLRVPRIDLRLKVNGSRLRAGARAWLRGTGTPVEAAIDLDRSTGNGRVYAGSRQADLSELAGTFRVGGVSLLSGRGRLRGWAKLDAHRIVGIRVDAGLLDVQLRGAPLQGKALASHTLGELVVDASWAGTVQQWTLHMPRLRVGTGNRRQTLDDLMVAGGAHYGLRAKQLDAAPLLQLATLSDVLPVGLRHWLRTTTPDVRLQDVDVVGQRGGSMRASAYIGDFRFDPVGHAPGMRGVSGWVEADQSGLRMRFDKTAQVTFDWPAGFGVPHAFTLDGEAVLWHEPDGWAVRTPGLAIAGAEINANARGGITFQNDGSHPHLDIAADIGDTPVSVAHGFWIHHLMPEGTVKWLDAALQGGTLRNTHAVVAGDLDDWPFRNEPGMAGAGVFRAETRIDNGTIKFQPDWPAADHLDADVSFIADGFTVNGRAQLAGVIVPNLQAGIARFGEAELTVDAATTGDAKQFLSLLRASPLHQEYGETLDGLRAAGPAQATYKMRLPLHHDEPVPPVIDGSVTLNGVRLQETRWKLDFTQVRGSAKFDQGGFVADGLQVRSDGLPGKLSLRAGPHVRDPAQAFEAQLHMQAEIGHLLDKAGSLGWLKPHMSGSSLWSVELAVPRGAAQASSAGALRLRSNLVGTALNLPAPLQKPATQAWPTAVDLRLPFDNGEVEVTLGQQLSLRSRTMNDKTGLRLQFGGARAGEPPAHGLLVAGQVDRLDALDWIEFASAGSKDAGLPLLKIDLKAKHLRLLGGDFADAGVVLSPTLRGTAVQIDGASIDGTLLIPEQDNAAVTARFDRLFWVPAADEKNTAQVTAPAAATASSFDPSSIPPLQIDVSDFRLSDTEMGAARFRSLPVAGGLRMEEFTTRGGKQRVTATGSWLGKGANQRSMFELDVESDDIGKLLSGVGFGGQVASGKGKLNANANWRGGPDAFDVRTVSAAMAVDAKDGRLLEVEPGAGRVLGLLGVAQLRRRLLLDFSDLFGKGFTFDRVRGSARLNHAQLTTNDLIVRGPAAELHLRGSTDLRNQRFDQTVEVLPKSGGLLTAVGALAGGPIGAAVGAVANAVLDKPMQGLGAKTYRVTGPWVEPKIEVIERDAAAPTPRKP